MTKLPSGMISARHFAALFEMPIAHTNFIAEELVRRDAQWIGLVRTLLAERDAAISRAEAAEMQNANMLARYDICSYCGWAFLAPSVAASDALSGCPRCDRSNSDKPVTWRARAEKAELDHVAAEKRLQQAEARVERLAAAVKVFAARKCFTGLEGCNCEPCYARAALEPTP